MAKIYENSNHRAGFSLVDGRHIFFSLENLKCLKIKNLDYLQHVKNWIKEVKEQYAVPIYHPDRLQKVGGH